MHRVDMPLSIQIIPDQMLPTSPLPDAPLALVASAFANPLAAGYPTRAIRFDQAPTHRIIAVGFCKRPHRMQMLRQQDPSDDLERMPLANITHDLPQLIDPVHQQATRPFRQVDREERGCAFDQSPTLTHVLQCRFMFVVVGWWNEAQRDVHRVTVLGFVPHPNLCGLCGQHPIEATDRNPEPRRKPLPWRCLSRQDWSDVPHS